MLRLIKQVIRSFKHSILLISGLIFISAVIIFSSFSSLYLGTNISNSMNNLNSTGNKSDAILEQNYAEANIQYQYEVDENGQLIKTQPSKMYKIDVDKLKANYGYQDGQTNVVFPYTNVNTVPYKPSNLPYWVYSFTFTGVNNPDAIFAYRDPGMMAGYGASDDGTPYGSPTSDYSTWVAKAAAFTVNGTQYTDFDKIFINPETKIIESYFSTNNKNFEDSIPIADGIFQANSSNLDPSKLNNAKPYNGTINSAFLDGVGGSSLQVGKTINYDVLDTSYLAPMYYLLESLIVEDQDLSQYQQVTVNLNKSLLTDFQRDVFDNYLDASKRKEYESFNVIVKNSWGVNSNDDLKSVVDKKIDDVISSLKTDLTKAYDVAIEDKLNKKNIENNQQKSFVITDQKTSHKYIVAQKDGVNIDSIVYTEGTKLANSTKYLDVNDLLSADTNNNSSGIKKYLKNLVLFLNDSMNVSGADYSDYLRTALESVADSLNNQTAVNNSYYNFIFAYFPNDYLYTNPENRISSNRQGYAIEYRLREGLTSAYLDSVIVNIDKDAYSTVVSDGYLKSNNKEIVPIDEWKQARSKSPYEFLTWLNNLDSKYYLEINSRKYVIISTGLSPEMAFPSTAIESPIPNTNTEAVVYVTENGYQSILYSAPLSYEYKYFSLDLGYSNIHNAFSVLNPSNSKLKQEINSLNNEFKTLINPNYSSSIVYSLDDYQNVPNLLTMRNYYPNQILYGVIIIAIVLIVVLIVLGLYLAYLLIKGYITKNQVQLAIIKANGFSSISITLSISLFGLVCSVIAGVAGYLTALFLQGMFYQILSPYWFAPIALLNFSPVGLIGGILSLLGVFTVFTFIIIRLTFRKPINELIAQNTEMKSSKLLNLLRRTSHKINPLFKFRLSLSASNVWRTIFFTALCSIGFSSIAVGIAIPDKFSQSSQQTSLNKHYEYRFDLAPTTEQSGLYKMQKYANLGFTDPSQGLYPLYATSSPVYYSYQYDANGNPIYTEDINQKTAYSFSSTEVNHPYKLQDLKVYTINSDDPNDIKIQQKRDEFGNLQYFGNILIPSYGAYRQIESQINFYQNSVFTKWLLDFTIPGLNINPWQLVKRIMPAEVITRAETMDQTFLEAIYNSENLNKLESVELNGVKEDLRPSRFITYDATTNLYSVDPNAIIGSLGKPDEIGYSKQFLAFVGLVYGDEEISNKDVKLSYGIVPYDENTETYTNVNVSFYNDWNQLLDNDVNLIGIKPDSQFITLVDTNKKDLNQLLDTYIDTNGQKIYSLIINQGAAYNYKLKVGSMISVSPNSDYFTNSNNVINFGAKKNSNPQQTYKFVVKGISSASYGDEFYISQNVANIINKTAFNLDNPETGGSFIANGPTDYSNIATRVQTSLITPGRTINTVIYDEENNNYGDGRYDAPHTNNNNYSDTYSVTNDFADHLTKSYVPFNGLISNSDKPLLLSQTVAFSNSIGIWNQYDYSSVDALVENLKQKFSSTIVNDRSGNFIYDAITTSNDSLLIENGFYELYENSSNPDKDRLKRSIVDPNNSSQIIVVVPNRAALKQALKANADTHVLLANLLINSFGNKPMDLSIKSIEAYGTVQYLYGNLIETINLAETIAIAILIPLIIVMVLVISSSMLEEFKRMIIVLKTIGYSDADNITSILLIFVPIVLLTLGIGTGLLFASFYLFQFVIYSASTVFISSAINWATFGIGFATILGVLIINFVAMIFMYKKQKLKTAIVD